MSVNIDECLTDVVGLSSSECECYEEFPENYTTSLSGLYVDDLLELGVVKGLENCANGDDFWQMMERARHLAIQQFKADVLAGLLMYNRVKRQPFKGAIGRTKTSATLTLADGNYAGVRLFCADIVGGTLTINSIGTLFDTTGTVDLYIYNNLNELVEGPITLNTTANTHEVNAITPVDLPLHNDMVDNLEYFFLYRHTAGDPQPLNNDATCNCTRIKLYFNTDSPYFGSQTDRATGWSRWVMAGGYNDSSIADLDDCSNTAANYMYGLTFPSVELRCNVQELICFDAIDFQADPLAASIAFAIRYKAGGNLVGDLLRSPELNRMVMLNHEQLAADRQEWETRYVEYVNYIVKNLDITANDCLECVEMLGFAKGGIYA